MRLPTTYLLDTNIISAAMRGDSALDVWLSTVDGDSRLITCPIVNGEIWYGIERLPTGRRREDLHAMARSILGSVLCEPVPPNAGGVYALIKTTQQKLGLSLDECDLWIAATALALGAVLVTRDSDFARIAGLEVTIPQ